MTFLAPYFAELDSSKVKISAQQGSDFAKQIASDFNPIHDVDSKRYCVPGDLLFALALRRYGLFQQMSFTFLDMVAGESVLHYPELSAGRACVRYADEANGNKAGKAALDVSANGSHADDSVLLETLIRKYVSFSGQNFPHILMPLMEHHDVMINPSRPLVIYESMTFDLQRLSFNDLQIRLSGSELDVQGKRGSAQLQFEFFDAQGQLGVGAKSLVLSGLRPFDKAAMQSLYEGYMANARPQS